MLLFLKVRNNKFILVHSKFLLSHKKSPLSLWPERAVVGERAFVYFSRRNCSSLKGDAFMQLRLRIS